MENLGGKNLTDSKLVIDTYAWIEYFKGSNSGKKARKYIENSYEIFTPSIVIAELSDVYRRRGLHNEWSKRKKFISIVSNIIKLDKEIGNNAGKIKQELRNKHKNAGLVDSIILSHGKGLKAKVLTGDDHLIDRNDVINIKN